MKLGSLFAGIGGFELAATWAGIEPIWSNEIDPFCCKVLRKNFNHEIIECDIKEIGKHNLEYADIVSAGVPCQPSSNAGKKKGMSDDRWQWGELIRVVRELKPAVVICENPLGILSLDNGKPFEGILFALENEGYEIELFNIPACSVQAEHRRERIWIIAHADKVRNKHDTNKVQSSTKTAKGKARKQDGKRLRGGANATLQKQTTTNPNSKRIQRVSEKPILWKLNIQDGEIEQPFQEANRRFDTFESRLCRTLHGLPFGVDRIKGLGNAIVPQVAYEIFKAIKF